jgi:two-component system response regulator PhoP
VKGGAMRLLLVEDESITRTTIHNSLQSIYAIDAVGTVKEATDLISYTPYDGAIVDIGLPDGSGLALLESIRVNHTFPVVIVTADNSFPAKTNAYHAGADDIVIKPFNLQELQMRLNAILRRSPHRSPDTYTIGAITLSKDLRTATYEGKTLSLRNLEFLILEYLASQPNIFISRSELIEKLWSEHTSPYSNCIESHIYSIRKAFRAIGAECPIETERNVGYCFRS